jgi:hypothetical protein
MNPIHPFIMKEYPAESYILFCGDAEPNIQGYIIHHFCNRDIFLSHDIETRRIMVGHRLSTVQGSSQNLTLFPSAMTNDPRRKSSSLTLTFLFKKENQLV